MIFYHYQYYESCTWKTVLWLVAKLNNLFNLTSLKRRIENELF